MEKKYKLLIDDTITVRGKTLYRIEAVRNATKNALFMKGWKGGYVENCDNLSHHGNCWIYDKTCYAMDNSVVKDAARLYEGARLCGDAQLMGHAVLIGNIKLSGKTKIGGNANVFPDKLEQCLEVHN